jgi:hypothetical protein
VGTVEHTYGLFKQTPDQVLDLHEKIANFSQEKERPAILILFVGVVNHWVTFVAYKPDPKNLSQAKKQKVKNGENLTKLYYLDSTNLVHMDSENATVPERIMDRVREKIRLGLKVTDKWTVSVTIQSFYDVRAFMAKLVHILNTPQVQLGSKKAEMPVKQEGWLWLTLP